MRVADFDFDLPPDLIAQHPASPRDSARLLVVGETLRDLSVGDLPGLLATGDVLVVNDTRVIPARLRGRRAGTGGSLEVTLIAPDTGGAWRALARPARRLRPGAGIEFPGGLSAKVEARDADGQIALRFGAEGDALARCLDDQGIMPLPPYIKRGPEGDPRDRADYQTLFADKPGAVAAPTAGLHFTPALVRAMEGKGVGLVRVTLHVGAGTFLPVKAADTRDHRMHAEWGEINARSADAVNAARDAGGRVVAVGSTALRLLETAADENGTLHPYRGETDIFITPGYRFRIVDALVTNFHLPRSTLFMLVAAFSGLGRMKAAYEHAKRTGYRFYSYGDACFLERGESP